VRGVSKQPWGAWLLAGVRCWLEDETHYLVLCFNRALKKALKKKKKKSNVSVCIYSNYPDLQPLVQAEQNPPGFSSPSSRILNIQYCTVLGALYLPTYMPIIKTLRHKRTKQIILQLLFSRKAINISLT